MKYEMKDGVEKEHALSQRKNVLYPINKASLSNVCIFLCCEKITWRRISSYHPCIGRGTDLRYELIFAQVYNILESHQSMWKNQTFVGLFICLY